MPSGTMFQIPQFSVNQVEQKQSWGWLGHIGSEQPPCFVGILEIYDLNRTVF